MAQMKMIARIVSDHRRQTKPGPSNRRRRRELRQRIGVKDIEGRIHSRTFKIKDLWLNLIILMSRKMV